VTAGCCPRCNATVIGDGTLCAACRPVEDEIERLIGNLRRRKPRDPAVGYALETIADILDLMRRLP
jgi:hypothetical protein